MDVIGTSLGLILECLVEVSIPRSDGKYCTQPRSALPVQLIVTEGKTLFLSHAISKATGFRNLIQGIVHEPPDPVQRVRAVLVAHPGSGTAWVSLTPAQRD